mmetsp:Transcript_20064/g.50075  ORF Transcript_20064/g.50075 Transcript_20064/m.50075 type:complete len:99 (+) Transcript_20064:148-444(+)
MDSMNAEDPSSTATLGAASASVTTSTNKTLHRRLKLLTYEPTHAESINGMEVSEELVRNDLLDALQPLFSTHPPRIVRKEMSSDCQDLEPCSHDMCLQ